MAIIRWTKRPFGSNPFAELDRLQNELNRLFQAVWGPEEGRRPAGVFPPVNISEDSDNVYIRAEMPGVTPRDVDLAVAYETVTLSGKRGTEQPEKVTYHRRERESGAFQRVITLPTRVKPGAVRATATDGILLVTLPKAEEVKPKRIAVEAV
ncbi:MAG: Hsp20/alpha crystallin family protein [Pseudomonadota bacterium]